uniref:Zinc resistance-associated protein n=1 Tax=Magnetococcus massalia (strain MO-1) TaxID=451514 RepID=A0A1S7LNT3_MAGMO|nr:Exported protein of unknown function [Candidatus Magnetococcus massalia]
MKQAPRWMKWVLFISLAFNALLITGFSVAFWRHGGPWMPGKHAMAHGNPYFMGHALHDLEPQMQQKVRPIMQQHAPVIRQSMHQVRSNRKRVHALLVQEQIDLEQLAGLFEELRHNTMMAQHNAHAMVVEAAAELPYASRTVLFKKRTWRRGNYCNMKKGERAR